MIKTKQLRFGENVNDDRSTKSVNKRLLHLRNSIEYAFLREIQPVNNLENTMIDSNRERFTYSSSETRSRKMKYVAVSLSNAQCCLHSTTCRSFYRGESIVDSLSAQCRSRGSLSLVIVVLFSRRRCSSRFTFIVAGKALHRHVRRIRDVR